MAGDVDGAGLMRILVVNWHDWTHPQAGGAELHLHEIAARWCAAGHEVTLLCAGETGKPGEEHLDGVRIVRIGSRETFNWLLPAAYARLRRERFDVVVEDMNKIPLYLPLFAGRPVVALVHHLFGNTVFLESNAFVGAYVWTGERGLRWAYRNTPLVAVSRSTRDDLVDRGLRAENVEVAYGGIDFPPPGLALARSADPLFTYLGRIKRYKQIELALRAFARLAVDLPRARFVVGGYGDHVAELRRVTARLGLGDRVSFRGRLEDPDKWRLLGESWAFLYTSPKEGWGLSSLEAQAAGVPVIASDSPGLRETLVEGETGFLVPHGDVDGLARRMRQLADDRELVERLGRRGRAHAAAFTWDRAAERLLDSLERTLRWREVEKEVARAAA